MSIELGSMWKNKDTGEGHIVRELLPPQQGIFGQAFSIVKTVSESGAPYTHTVDSLRKYYDEVYDVKEKGNAV